jgi:hypothetical protein
MRIFLSLLTSLLLAGCAATAPQQTPRYLHQVPVGTLLSLERSLAFQDGATRVYLQDGQVHKGFGFFGYGGVNRYRAHCMLELAHRPTADLTLSPREFRLATVRWDVTYQQSDTSEFRTEWRLTDGGEPRVHAFTCIKAGNAAYEPPLTLQEIDQVVGDYFRLKSAGGS